MDCRFFVGCEVVAQYGQQTVAFAAVGVLAEPFHELNQSFGRVVVGAQVLEGLLLQIRNSEAQQHHRHFRLAAGKVVVQRGFAEPAGRGQVGQCGAVVTALDEHLPEPIV